MKKILATILLGSLVLGSAVGVVEAENENNVSVEKETEASITFNQGDLLLTHVPTLDFGSQKIENSTDYTTTNSTTVLRDHRGLNGAWALDASISKFENKAGEETLPGFKLSFNDGETYRGLTNAIDKPEVFSKTLQPGEEGASNTQRLIEADVGEGRGTWTTTWSEINLNVPSGSRTVGDHTATITWTLTNAL